MLLRSCAIGVLCLAVTAFALGNRRMIAIPTPDDKPLLTCDAITPGLCDFDETSGFLDTRGYKLKYFSWKPRNKPADKPALIGLHGGPGGNHWELYTLRQLACSGRQVVLYDQLGAGESDRPSRDAAPWLWTIEYYLDEVDTVATSLKIKGFYLLGHSWGGIVAQMYAIKRGADARLKGLVLASIFSDADLYIKGQWEHRLSSLPLITKKIIKDAEVTKDYSSPAYKAIDDTLTTFYTVRTVPWPDCLVKAFSGLNMEIYVGMQGASEFTLGGVLAGFNTTADLPNIKVPTLITAGEYDTMTPPVIELLYQRIPNSDRIYFPHSGHMTMIDDAGLYNDALLMFFRKAEKEGGLSPTAARRTAGVMAGLLKKGRDQ